jgi:putative MATE family efflux protein
MQAVGLNDETRKIALDYLWPLMFILAIQMIETGGIACLVGAGDTRTGLLILLTVAIVNCPVAYSLSTGAWGMPNWGFEGIAYGTASAHAAGGCVILALLFVGRSGLKLRLQDFLPDLAMIKRLLKVSVPAAADSLSVAVCQLWFLRIVNSLGSAAAAGHGIALRWEGLGYLSGAAFSAAGSSLVSRNLGAKQPAEAAKGGFLALGIGAIVMTIWGIVFATLARPMSELYVDANSQDREQVITSSVTALRTIAVVMPWLACAIILTGCLRGAGDTRVPVIFTWVGFLGVRIPLGYLLTAPVFGLGIFGIWLAMNADIVLRGSLIFLRFLSGKWKRIKV